MTTWQPGSETSSAATEREHRPVMPSETLDLLAVREGGTYLDCTLGGGGHALEIVRRAGPSGCLIGLDRDESALERAAETLRDVSGRVTLINSDYQYLDEVLNGLGIPGADGILFDLGVSTWQVLDPGRGFSYNNDAPLDMRMDRKAEVTAADLVNRLTERELARIIRRYGEERWAERIASFIAAGRARRPITTTGELVEIIKAAIPAAARRTGPHPAKRTFQALRIAVNDELSALERALRSGIRMLKPGGRMVAISFHSLEDRIVKNVFKERALSRDGREPIAGEGLRLLTRKPLRPEAAEVAQNPRARSARLRAAERYEPGSGAGQDEADQQAPSRRAHGKPGGEPQQDS
jgi:16S rRNA (cytosine1402-N4)-methyltransferase